MRYWLPAAQFALGGIAIGLSLVALSTSSPPRDGTRDGAAFALVSELRDEIGELRAEVARIAERQMRTDPRRGGSARTTGSSPGDATDGAAGKRAPDGEAPDDHYAALVERLDRLEDEETIARLATAGFGIVRKKDLDAARARVMDRETDVSEQLAAFASLRKSESFGDAEVLAIVDLARDATLDSETRATAVRYLEGVRSPTVVRPMLDLLAFDQDAEVREQTLDVLIYHHEDANVADTIRRVAQSDPQDIVRERALRYLPKFDVEARAALEARGRQEGEK